MHNFLLYIISMDWNKTIKLWLKCRHSANTRVFKMMWHLPFSYVSHFMHSISIFKNFSIIPSCQNVVMGFFFTEDRILWSSTITHFNGVPAFRCCWVHSSFFFLRIDKSLIQPLLIYCSVSLIFLFLSA